MMLPITVLVIQEDGFIELEVTTAGETIRAGRTKVQFAPPPARALADLRRFAPAFGDFHLFLCAKLLTGLVFDAENLLKTAVVPT
jgi:hypothetical protein